MKIFYLIVVIWFLFEGSMYAFGIVDITRYDAAVNTYLVAYCALLGYLGLRKKDAK